MDELFSSKQIQPIKELLQGDEIGLTPEELHTRILDYVNALYD
jgi:hypothetical protein